MIHKIWFEEDNEGIKTDIEFWYSETEEEDEQFNYAIKKLELMSYFIGN